MAATERPQAGSGHGDSGQGRQDRQPGRDRPEETPTAAPTARPADVAREALRAAREQQPAAGGPADLWPDAAAGRQPRPGDAARAALRRATPPDAPARRPTHSGEGPTDTAGPASARTDKGAARPGDAAREALRAARGRRPQEAPQDGASQDGAPQTDVPQTDVPQTDVRQVGAPSGRPAGAEGVRRPQRATSRVSRPRSSGPVADADVRGQDTGKRPADKVRTSAPSSPGRAHPPSVPEDEEGEERDPSRTLPHHTGARSDSGTRPGTGTGTRIGPPGSVTRALFDVPRTMASPRRDGELRRTFPAQPAPASPGSRSAGTWWGNAWITALEEGALDAARLARGRGYAETGHVDAITVTPGLVLAYVQGSRPRPYRAQVRLRTLDDADWDRFLDAAAERPGHIAALLDKEMPPSLADCGIPLLPGPGDLEPHCSCPDRGHPCKHAAALCYQTARLLDADPFVLLLLRGRGERDLLDALARLSATRAARAAQEQEPGPLPGVRAADILARRRTPPPPAPLPPPPHPGQPPVYPAAPGGPDPFALDQLATDAAARAHALLTTGRDPVGGLTLWQDAVRLAAARPGSGLTAAARSLYASLASATGRTPAELARAVEAWRQGGREGLAVLEDPWDLPAGRFDRARPLLLAAGLPAFRPWRNRLTHPDGRLQLRLGLNGLWYAYESEPGRDDWWPRGSPDPDPVGALTALAAPGGL